MALKSDYDLSKASLETREAMKNRCYEQGHVWEMCATALFQFYEKCKWCGVTR